MRSFVLLSLFLALPGAASAGTIITIDSPNVVANSIMTIGGDTEAVAPKPEKAASTPVVAPDREVVQVKHVGGETTILRTSAWLGGSPVTYAYAASPEDLAALKRQGIDVASSAPQTIKAAVMLASEKPEAGSVDTHEVTSALPGSDGKNAGMASLDAKDLKLRPNVQKD